MSTAHDPKSTPPDSWLRAKALFNEVVTLPADQRTALLDARCGDDAELRHFVENLLRSDDALATGHSEAAQRGLGSVLRRAVRDAWPPLARGHRFGAFAVVEEIGRGGMGIVYLAERHDGTVLQKVALKLVPPDALHGEASQRLARERRLLATLEHPNIARLIDAGEDASGIPYFAMEYVRGAPITAHCDRLALPLHARLRLFRQVCAAVQFAHAKLIVHCDIKASNVLVTDDGLPKLLDFGIATSLDAPDDAGENRFLSPQTAAPEQFLGQNAGVAADVYALGILLCELCGGQRPFAGTGEREELRQRVLHEAPALPSRTLTAEAAARCGAVSLATLQRKLAGDIDAVVAKALRKDPAQRYTSVEQLDAEIARHLERQPVQARAGERGYRLGRFLQRNALAAVFGAAVVGFVIVLAWLLIAFAASTARQNAQLAHERDQAQQRERQAQFERERAQQVTDFMVGLFKAAMPQQARGEEITARKLLQVGSQQLRNRLDDQPQLKAAMLAAIGEAQLELDDLDSAEQAAREGLLLRGAVRPPLPGELADSLKQLATVAARRGRFAQSLALVDQAQALALTDGGIDPAPLINLRAGALQGLGRRDDAIAASRALLARQLQRYGARDLRTARAAVQLSSNLGISGFRDEAEQVLLAHLPTNTDGAGSDDPVVGEMLLSLARMAREREDLERAERMANDALAIYRKVYGEHASLTVLAMNMVAMVANARGDYAKALQLFKQALATSRALDRDGPRTAMCEYNVGLMLFGSLERPREALPYLQRAVELAEKLYTPDHSVLARFRMFYGAALSKLGRYDSAETVLRQALTVFEEINSPRGVDIATSRGELACIALARGRATAAAKAQVAASVAVVTRYNFTMDIRRLRACAERWGIPLAATATASPPQH